MVEEFVRVLVWSRRLSDPLAWIVVTAFLAGAVLEQTDRDGARRVTVVGWLLFAVFWFSLIHYYLVVSKSAIEGIGCIVAVPACVYTGYLLSQGRDSLFVLSRAVGAMGLVFLPFEAIPLLTTALIETVTHQTEFVMGVFGQTAPADFRVVSGTVVGRPDRRSTFLFVDDTGHRLTYTIRIACTGLGSMAIFGGLIGAVRAPLSRKLRALAVSIPVIYVLNLIRNTFIGLTFGQQRLHVAPDLVLGLFSATDPYKVSYFLADRVLAQSLSVLVLIVITWFVIRELPAVLVVIEDLMYLFTGTDYDLQSIVAGGDSTHTE
ncbi:archaeosortase A [Halocatena pleomorpha]|uniref:Archaeosortase A n=1 Tax=Halocatena pleomorpha TaxID=1785090 RepID=A0A3P3RF13_9EURY|nr:archaeosortase A [Halocatena pleomorpha]RRJ31991.1 archaeosortase A [Halocatena pleomorpha]